VCRNGGCGSTRSRAHERAAGGLQSAYRRRETEITFGFEHTRSRLRVCHRFQGEYSGVVRKLRGRSRTKNTSNLRGAQLNIDRSLGQDIQACGSQGRGEPVTR